MKTPTAALLLLALSASLGAQQTPSSNPITTAFKGRISGLSHNVAQAFDSIPESKFSYKPTPAQLSIGYIAQHVADDNYFFCNGFSGLTATVPTDEANTPDSVKASWPKAKLVAQLKASFDFCDRAMAEVTDASLAEQTTLSYGGRARQVARATMVLGHALDLADHYSQLANYMRLNGILPPTALPRPRRGGGGGE
ncbi:MAG: DinB family protein [Gemmatimonadaceae bacterium]